MSTASETASQQEN